MTSESKQLPSSVDPPRLFTAQQAAELLQVPTSWLRKKATARAVPCTFIGKHLRFSTADIAEIIRTGARPINRHSRDRSRKPPNDPVWA